MIISSIRPNELTPAARIAAAKKKLADAIDELIEARLAESNSRSEWVSQDDSPLGHDRHLRLVRKKILPAVADGRKRLVRRIDIDAYLEKRPAKAAQPTTKYSDDELEEMAAIGGVKR